MDTGVDWKEGDVVARRERAACASIPAESLRWLCEGLPGERARLRVEAGCASVASSVDVVEVARSLPAAGHVEGVAQSRALAQLAARLTGDVAVELLECGGLLLRQGRSRYRLAGGGPEGATWVGGGERLVLRCDGAALIAALRGVACALPVSREATGRLLGSAGVLLDEDDGGGWAAATDGHQLAARRLPCAPAERVVVPAAAMRYLGLLSGTVEVAVSDRPLRTWLRAVDGERRTEVSAALAAPARDFPAWRRSVRDATLASARLDRDAAALTIRLATAVRAERVALAVGDGLLSAWGRSDAGEVEVGDAGSIGYSTAQVLAGLESMPSGEITAEQTGSMLRLRADGAIYATMQMREALR